MKIEECIKKGKECYEENLQRSVAAEVSPGLTQMCLRDKAGGHFVFITYEPEKHG